MTRGMRCRVRSTIFLKSKRGERDSRVKGDWNNAQHSLSNNTVIFLGLICIGKSNSFESWRTCWSNAGWPISIGSFLDIIITGVVKFSKLIYRFGRERAKQNPQMSANLHDIVQRERNVFTRAKKFSACFKNLDNFHPWILLTPFLSILRLQSVLDLDPVMTLEEFFGQGWHSVFPSSSW